MRVETEDAAERRFTGLITGISDVDPVRWPGSRWRCLLVRWDNEIETNRQNRVSPWEIEPSGSVSGPSGLSSPGSKRNRIGFPSTKPDFPVPNGTGYSDFGEPKRFQKVLQGQEILGFSTRYDAMGMHNLSPSEIRKCITGSNSIGMTIDGDIQNPLGNSDISYKGKGFGESVRFHKVLQGQEIFPKPPIGRSLMDNWAHENGGIGVSDGAYVSRTGIGWPVLTHDYSMCLQASPSYVQMSSPSSLLVEQAQAHSFYGVNNHKGEGLSSRGLLGSSEISLGKMNCYTTEDMGNMYSGNTFKGHDQMGNRHFPPALITQNASKSGKNSIPSSTSGCRLFGFPLPKDSHIENKKDSNITTPVTSLSNENLNHKGSFLFSAGKKHHLKPPILTKGAGRSCIKVHKQGSVVGRAIDLAKLGGYDDLICELERLFNMEGLLNDPNKGWQIVYTDHEDDMMLVGDDPWQDFCNIVSKISIYTHDEVIVASEVVTEDSHSCSEEVPGDIPISEFSRVP